MNRRSEVRDTHRHRRYALLCARLAAYDSRLPRWLSMRRTSGAQGPRTSQKTSALSRSLSQASIPLSVDQVLAGARFAAILSSVATALTACALMASGRSGLALSFAAAAIASPLAAREAVLSYPRTSAARRAASVARSSTESVSLMIMCLRHESSLSKAMAFAAGRRTEFASELRGAIWSVMTDIHSTFEGALTAVGTRWSDSSPELKSSVQSMITASCEATEAGRRRALDRANRSIVAGARRRIEEYALSLSVPSMVLFGVGIILPLMVGSFLPLMSWQVWTDDLSQPAYDASASLQSTGQVVFLMNILFPAIAFLVAADALSRRPFAGPQGMAEVGRRRASATAYALSASVASLAGLSASLTLLDGNDRYVAFLLAATIPPALSLATYGARASESTVAFTTDSMSDLLFRTGSLMVEGENFEAAQAQARAALREDLPPATDLLPCGCLDDGASSRVADASAGALEVVREAAVKDEAQAGILAMDLSGYLKEVAELQATMRRSLKPTVSMMRITTHVLAPIVLGITYAIYMSLAAIGEGEAVLAGPFLVVLGAFLAEMNAVVAYFVWGIGETRRPGELAYSAGTCILISILVYSATVVVAS